MADIAAPIALAAAAAGLVAALPIAATAFEVPAAGPVRPQLRWWSSPISRTVSAVYALVTASIALAVCLRIGWRISMPGFWLFSVLGVGIAYVDVRRHRLPHVATGTLWSSCATLFVIESVHSGQIAHLIEAISCGLAVSAVMLLIALTAPGQLGLGDVHFAGAVALTLGWLGWEIAAVAVVIAVAIQWTWTLMAVVRTRDRKIALPFGPALFGAWAIAIVVA